MHSHPSPPHELCTIIYSVPMLVSTRTFGIPYAMTSSLQHGWLCCWYLLPASRGRSVYQRPHATRSRLPVLMTFNIVASVQLIIVVFTSINCNIIDFLISIITIIFFPQCRHKFDKSIYIMAKSPLSWKTSSSVRNPRHHEETIINNMLISLSPWQKHQTASSS